jgi:hypothetical protein
MSISYPNRFSPLMEGSTVRNPNDSKCIDLPLTRSMIYARTVQLATLAGRPPHAIKQVDYEQAKQEFIQEPNHEQRQLIFDRMAFV